MLFERGGKAHGRASGASLAGDAVRLLQREQATEALMQLDEGRALEPLERTAQ
jgi:hypothetical protein